jgi:hypothetical protein
VVDILVVQVDIKNEKGEVKMTNFQTYREYEIGCKLGDNLPLDVMVVGATGAGKSSLVNALCGGKVARVGEGVDPETMDVKRYELNNHFCVWDTPGLGDSAVADARHKRKIVDSLLMTYESNGRRYSFMDMVLVVLEGGIRDMGSCYSLLNEVIVPNIDRERILVAINQADIAMKGTHWDSVFNRPDAVLESFLRDKAESVRRRVYEATGVSIRTPVCFSAETGYNMKSVVDAVVEQIPRYRPNVRRA